MKHGEDFVTGILKSVATAAVLAILGAAVKTYLDVQELKARFEYVNGTGWTVPAKK